jgi:signal transduction histidine kinase
MNALIESLVNLSTISDSTHKEKIKLSEEIVRIIKNYTLALSQNKINIKFQKESEFTVYANSAYIAMLVSNLLSNAIKYNKK